MYWLYNGGDIQRFSDKLPGLPWAKYSGEKHLFNHSFTGHGTRLDLRLNSDDTPITKSINRVDAAAYKHDLVYRDHVDLESRHAAHLQMIQELESIPNPTFREKLDHILVIRLVRAKMKLGMGFEPVGRPYETIGRGYASRYKLSVLARFEKSNLYKVHLTFQRSKLAHTNLSMVNTPPL